MVAKPTTETRDIFVKNMWVDGDPAPSPIHLDFRPVLKILAEAGIDGVKLDKWLLDLNEANRELVGKLELTSEGALLISPMQSKKGSREEAEIIIDLGAWTRTHGGEAHGARLGLAFSQRHTLRSGCGVAVTRTTGNIHPVGRNLAPGFLPIFRRRDHVPQRQHRQRGKKDARLRRPRRDSGMAHRPLPTPGPRLSPQFRPRRSRRPRSRQRRPGPARVQFQCPGKDFRRPVSAAPDHQPRRRDRSFFSFTIRSSTA